MKRCAHPEVLVEVTHGHAWTLLDRTGDVVDDGLEAADLLRLAVICGRCRLTYSCTEATVFNLPEWALVTTLRVVGLWRSKRLSYQASARSAAVRECR